MSAEPRNLILCSDGTGNAGGKERGTNVWRIYQATERNLDKSKTEQFVFYEDGVGTDSFKLFKIIGGAFGWGITRNLKQLYSYLLRQFQPNDNIYLFGFSRGAFTVRTLANILYECGIADRSDHSPEELDEIAGEAVAAYKKRHTSKNATRDFRLKYGLKHDDPEKQGDEHIGRFPIHFIGVWDTVDAVGLPFQSLTQAFLWLPFFSLNLRQNGPSWRDWEDDLNPLVRNAYHALAIDDQRYTFQPLLWIEHTPEGIHKTEIAPEDRPVDHLNGTPRKVEQVWFAGVHANVGGGYPKDQLSFVPLVWMMEHAEREGLAIKESLRVEFERDQDVHGRLYNSRSGMKAYYRYRPREIHEQCKQVGNDVARIHETVFQRIEEQTQDYAPSGIPKPEEYEVVGDPLVTRTKAGKAWAGRRKIGDVSESRPHRETNSKRWHIQEYTRDFIWWRRFLYSMFLLWSILSVVTGVLIALPDVVLPEEPWLYDSRFWGITMTTLVSSLLAISFARRAIKKTIAAEAKRQEKIKANEVDAHREHREYSHATAKHATFMKRMDQLADFASLFRDLAIISVLMVFSQNMIVDRVAAAIPGIVGSVIGSVASNTTVFLLIGLGAYVIFNRWHYARAKIRDISVAAWKTGLHLNEGQAPKDFCLGVTSSFGLLEVARHFRKRTHFKRLRRFVDNYVAPALALIAVCGLLLSFVIAEGSAQYFEFKMNQGKTPRKLLVDSSEKPITFDTTCVSRATGFFIERGRRYRITLEMFDPDNLDETKKSEKWNWKDLTYEATPNGLKRAPWWLTLALPLKRHADQPWGKVMAAIGPNHDFVYPIGTENVFVAEHSGELMLYVNDAAGFYHNNKGCANVSVVCVDDTVRERLPREEAQSGKEPE